MNDKEIVDKVFELYEKYGVDRSILESRTPEQIILGMKGVLAYLDKNKKQGYEKTDSTYIKEIYARCC